MCAKPTYLPLDAADDLERFIIRREYTIGNSVRARTRNYDTLGILKLLYQLRGGRMTSSELFASSMFRMRRSFREYLDLCIDYGFVRPERVRKRTLYAITDRGWGLLRAFVSRA